MPVKSDRSVRSRKSPLFRRLSLRPRLHAGATAALVLMALFATLSSRSEAQFSLLPVEVFLAKPYVQLGKKTPDKQHPSHEIIWIARDSKSNFSVDYRARKTAPWKTATTEKRVIHEQLPSSICRYSAALTDLLPGVRFDYVVKKDNAVVFSADALAVKDASQTYSFVVVGDLGAGSIGQKRIAQAVYKAKPDFVVMPGDLTYNFGRLSEYFTRFFPVYNSDSAASDAGVPLMRSTLCMPVLGNHDIAVTGSNTPTDLNTYPDALAYFLVWSSPLNGPLGETHTANRPMITGDVQRLSAFRAAAESRYPRMANYSFDYANSHWLVLDANYYMDWSDKTLRKWVETDLNNAKGAKWRFVTFHQPSFSADEAHFKEQRMRVLCNLFESKGVDIVFAGHAHNYQRTYPLRFRVRDTSRMIADGTVSGDIALDHSFDDSAKTKPKGIIYIVTGAGGAKLYKPVSTDKMNWLGNFIKKLNADVHSYTMCKVNGATLSLQQISDRGEVLDQFTLSKD